MGIFSKMKKLVSLDDYDVEMMEAEDEVVAEEDTKVAETRYASANVTSKSRGKRTSIDRAVGAEDLAYSTASVGTASSKRKFEDNMKSDSSVLKLNDRIAAITKQYKIVINRPEAFEDATKIVNSLKAKRPVIVSLEGLDIEIQRKIFDFLSGAVYALDYRIDKLSTLIYMFSPDNVEISSDSEKNEINFKNEDNSTSWTM